MQTQVLNLMLGVKTPKKRDTKKWQCCSCGAQFTKAQYRKGRISTLRINFAPPDS